MKKQIFTLLAVAFTFLFTSEIYSQAGTIDSSFGVNGISLSFKSSSVSVYDIATTADGKIIAVGDKSAATALVIRYTSNGSIDSTFGTNGLANTSIIHASGSTARVVKLQKDGKIIVAINSNSINGTFYSVIRYNPNGTPDSSFGTNAVVRGSLSLSMNEILDMVIQADGKILAAGSDFGSVAALVRYNPNGTLDASFGDNGILNPDTTDYNYNYFVAVGINSKNHIVAFGSNRGTRSQSKLYLTSFDINGNTDYNFGNNGVVLTGNKESFETGRNMKILPDDKILVAFDGSISDPYESADFVLRYNANGTIDKTFGRGGKVKLGQNQQFFIGDLLLQPDGKILAAGSYLASSNPGIAMYRLLPDGSYDNSFGENGVTHMHIGRAPFLNALALQNDGKIIAGGSTSYPNKPLDEIFLARYFGNNQAFAANNNTQNITIPNSTVAVFPNPAKNLITVTGLSTSVNSIIYIVDNNGKVVKQTSSQNSTAKTIDISSLTPGLYYVKITTGKNTSMLKLLKQ